MTLSKPRRYRFPSEVIASAVVWCTRDGLSFRDTSEALAIRGIDVSYETVRKWCDNFSKSRLPKALSKASGRIAVWKMHAREVTVAGKNRVMYLALSDQGQIADFVVLDRPDPVVADLHLRRQLGEVVAYSTSNRSADKHQPVLPTSIERDPGPSSSVRDYERQWNTQRWYPAGDVEQVLANAPVSVRVAGMDIALFKVGGQICALADMCSHMCGRLSEGVQHGTAIECPLHLGRVCLLTGSPLREPVTEPVSTYEVRIVSGEVLIRI